MFCSQKPSRPLAPRRLPNPQRAPLLLDLAIAQVSLASPRYSLYLPELRQKNKGLLIRLLEDEIRKQTGVATFQLEMQDLSSGAVRPLYSIPPHQAAREYALALRSRREPGIVFDFSNEEDIQADALVDGVYDKRERVVRFPPHYPLHSALEEIVDALSRVDYGRDKIPMLEAYHDSIAHAVTLASAGRIPKGSIHPEALKLFRETLVDSDGSIDDDEYIRVVLGAADFDVPRDLYALAYGEDAANIKYAQQAEFLGERYGMIGVTAAEYLHIYRTLYQKMRWNPQVKMSDPYEVQDSIVDTLKRENIDPLDNDYDTYGDFINIYDPWFLSKTSRATEEQDKRLKSELYAVFESLEDQKMRELRARQVGRVPEEVWEARIKQIEEAYKAFPIHPKMLFADKKKLDNAFYDVEYALLKYDDNLDEEIEQAIQKFVMYLREMEKMYTQEAPGVQIVTDAPVSYDGFGTLTVRELGLSTRGNMVRLVAIQKQHLQWQQTRYASGNYLGMSPEQFEELKDSLMPGEKSKEAPDVATRQKYVSTRTEGEIDIPRIGKVPVMSYRNVLVGDVLVHQSGLTAIVLSVKQKGKKTLEVTSRSLDDGRVFTQSVKKDTQIGFDPDRGAPR